MGQENKGTDNRPGERTQLDKNAPANELLEGSQNSDQLHSGSGNMEDPERMRKGEDVLNKTAGNPKARSNP